MSYGGYSRAAEDELAVVAPLLDRCGDFAAFLGSAEDQQATRALREAETSGRPLGAAEWIAALEARSGRALAARKRGPKVRKRDERDGSREFRLLSP